MNDLVITPEQTLPATAAEIRKNVNLIQQVMESVMVPEVHYGTIPGCGDKPALFKAGAEKIMATFRLAADPEVSDLSSHDEAKYRVKVRLTSPSGIFVGSGIGTCSSNEEKYKWRRCYIKEEFEDTPEDRRREKWSQYRGSKPQKNMQIRTNIADADNTILKMAKKRALIDAVLTATAASDIFFQDIEDIPEEMLGNGEPAAPQEDMTPQSKAPKPKAAGNGPKMAEGPLKVIQAKLDAKGLSAEKVCAEFKSKDLPSLKMAQVNDILSWIDSQ